MNISDDLNYVCKIKKWLRILNISYQKKTLNIKHGMNIYDTNDISIEVVCYTIWICSFWSKNIKKTT